MGEKRRRGKGEVGEAEGLLFELVGLVSGSMVVAAKLGSIFKMYLKFDMYVTLYVSHAA